MRASNYSRCKPSTCTLASVATLFMPTPDFFPGRFSGFSSPRQPQRFTCDEVCADVLLLHVLAKERRAKRFDSGALSLNTPKLTFKLDDNGNPIEFRSYPIRDSNKLVEVCG